MGAGPELALKPPETAQKPRAPRQGDLPIAAAAKPRQREKRGPDKPFHLTGLNPTETARQHQVIDYLRAQQARGRIVWFCRLNGGAVKTDNRWIANYRSYLPGTAPSSAGVSDLLVLLPEGRLAALEIKRPGERATEAQIAFLETVRAGGGLAAVVCGVEDVARVLFERNSHAEKLIE